MAGVYIKGIEMPRNCHTCVLRFMRYCPITRGDLAEKETRPYAKRPADCNLISVPDHGRLIDADALTYLLAMDEHFSPLEAMYLMTLVADSPTIIPAEKEAEE